MKHTEKILILGGDLRQKYLYYELLDQNYHVSVFGTPGLTTESSLLESVDNCTVVILPIPYSKDNKNIFTTDSSFEIPIDYILSHFNTKTIIYGGCFKPSFSDRCKQLNLVVKDFMDNPLFELRNSIATAEGAIAEAIIHSPINIHQTQCLILGYGKCGKSIASRLKGLNAYTTVCARNPLQLADAYENGHNYCTLNDLNCNIGRYDFIFNTIPAMVLNRDILCNAKSEVTIIDIASKPGGTDFDTCRHFGLNSHLCLSLPGKYSPKSSSHIIYKCLDF